MSKTVEEKIKVSLEKEKGVSYKNTQVAWVNFKNKNSIIQKCYVKLHGNLIAVFFNDNVRFNLWISNCGYYTKTTKSRLNIILQWYYQYQIKAIDEFEADLFMIHQCQHKWYVTQTTLPNESFIYDSLLEEGWLDINHLKTLVANRIYL